ncbi:hypothetical protein IBX65_02545 [Candidatus Aerophobetes bacterium]|nr:hypothetical protein [Candidatus Aerophobetes bacterium]
MSTWSFRGPTIKFQKNDKVQVTRAFAVPGMGMIQSGETGTVKDISAAGEPLVELENKNLAYLNPQFLKKI